MLEIARNKRTPHFKKEGFALNGYSTHITKAKNRPMAGAPINGRRLASEGFDISFTKSLIASAKG